MLLDKAGVRWGEYCGRYTFLEVIIASCMLLVCLHLNVIADLCPLAVLGHLNFAQLKVSWLSEYP